MSGYKRKVGRVCANNRCAFSSDNFICWDDRGSFQYPPRIPLTLHDPGMVPEKEYTVHEVRRYLYADPKGRFEYHLCETCHNAVQMVRGGL